MSSYLNQQVLVLNRLWQAVNVCSARRALTLLFEGRAQVVLNNDDGSFQTYNFHEWHDFSQQEPHPESIHTISFRIRVPTVILLLLFDRLPKKEVKFTRHNIFERDSDRIPRLYYASNPLLRRMFWNRLHVLNQMLNRHMEGTESCVDFGGGAGVLLPTLSAKFRRLTLVDLE